MPEDIIRPNKLIGGQALIYQCSKGCWHFKIEINGRWLGCWDEFESKEAAQEAFAQWWPSTIYWAEGKA